jgi:hypothetical protein
MSDSIQYAFVIKGDKQQVCTISEMKNDDVFYLVTNGANSDVMRAMSAPQIKKVNGIEQWRIEGVPYE